MSRTLRNPKRRKSFIDENKNEDKRYPHTKDTKKQPPIKRRRLNEDEDGFVSNKDIIDKFTELAELERTSGDIRRAIAYRKAATALKKSNERITSGKQAMKLKNIGQRMADKIDEILSTGHLEKLQKLKNDKSVQAASELRQIHGIGPKKANILVKHGHIHNIAELKEKDFLLNETQKKGLKYFEQINYEIPRDQITKIAEWMEKEIKMNVNRRIKMTVCGEYRRQSEFCKNIQILMTHQAKKYEHGQHGERLLSDTVRMLKNCGFIVEDLSFGPTKYIGIARYKKHTINTMDDDGDVELTDYTQSDEQQMDHSYIYRKIIIQFTSFKHYYANLLNLTGSQTFNIEMRTKANMHSLVLTQNGLYKHKGDTQPIIIPKSEKDIFDAIGMSYVAPQDRDY